VLGILDAACVIVSSGCLIMGEDGEGLLLLAFRAHSYALLIHDSEIYHGNPTYVSFNL
jgi:hypothetical protein